MQRFDRFLGDLGGSLEFPQFDRFVRQVQSTAHADTATFFKPKTSGISQLATGQKRSIIPLSFRAIAAED